VWAWAGVGGLVAVLTGFVPLNQAGDVVVRVAPVLVFLVAITVVAELADAAGVFTVAATTAARAAARRPVGGAAEARRGAARGPAARLWLLVVVLAVAAITVLSLDTTAVLLTPVVLTLARRLGLPPGLFAMTTVWLANTASLLLPVSNLTNLLALHRLAALGVDLPGYVRLMAAPAAVSVVVTCLVLAVLFRRTLPLTYWAPAPVPVRVRVLFGVCAGTCLALGPAFVTGVVPAVPAAAAAAVLLGVFAVRDRRALAAAAGRLVPWRLVLLVLGLFLVVQGLQGHGLPGLLADVAGSGTSWPDLLRLAGTSAVAANGVDNLPAYLALEPVAADTPERLAALLIGVNLGPLVTVWASLATLLWRERCTAAGVPVPAGRFAARGLLLVPLLLVTTTPPSLSPDSRPPPGELAYGQHEDTPNRRRPAG